MHSSLPCSILTEEEVWRGNCPIQSSISELINCSFCHWLPITAKSTIALQTPKKCLGMCSASWSMAEVSSGSCTFSGCMAWHYDYWSSDTCRGLGHHAWGLAFFTYLQRDQAWKWYPMVQQDDTCGILLFLPSETISGITFWGSAFGTMAWDIVGLLSSSHIQ